MLNALCYDIEIENPILQAGESIPGIEYCKGWSDHANMGIACICAYDYKEDRYRVFTDGTFDEFLSLRTERAPLVGFNNINFDNVVIVATLAKGALQDLFWPDVKCYDLLREIWAANGLGPEFQPDTHGGYGLDAVCQANGLGKKTGTGALAPVWWQQGQYGRVIDYCLNDVRLTKKLFDLAIDNRVRDPKTGKLLNLPDPMVQ